MRYEIFGKKRIVNKIPRDIFLYSNVNNYNTQTETNILNKISQIKLLLEEFEDLSQGIIDSTSMSRNITNRRLLKCYCKYGVKEGYRDLVFKENVYKNILLKIKNGGIRFCSYEINNIYTSINGLNVKGKYNNNFYRDYFKIKKIESIPSRKVLEELIFDIENYWYSNVQENDLVKLSLIIFQFMVIDPFGCHKKIMEDIIFDLFIHDKKLINNLSIPIGSFYEYIESYEKNIEDIIANSNYSMFIDIFFRFLEICMNSMINDILSIIKKAQQANMFIYNSNKKYARKYEKMISFISCNGFINYKDICNLLELSFNTSKKLTDILINNKIISTRKLDKKSKVFILE